MGMKIKKIHKIIRVQDHVETWRGNKKKVSGREPECIIDRTQVRRAKNFKSRERSEEQHSDCNEEKTQRNIRESFVTGECDAKTRRVN